MAKVFTCFKLSSYITSANVFQLFLSNSHKIVKSYGKGQLPFMNDLFPSVVTPAISLIEFRLAKAFTQPDNLSR